MIRIVDVFFVHMHKLLNKQFSFTQWNFILRVRGIKSILLTMMQSGSHFPLLLTWKTCWTNSWIWFRIYSLVLIYPWNELASLLWRSEWDCRGRFKNAYELLNLRALKIPMLYKNRIFQCMSKIFCVEFQRVPLKFHTKYLTHALKDVNFIHRWNFKSS